jgi:uncharacterized protein
MENRSSSGLIKTAVVTGGHAFDVVNFHKLFRKMDGIDAYVQHLDDFSVAPPEVRDSYDVVVFYIMMQATPVDEGLPWYWGKPKTALENLGKRDQGIVVLHHAILAYPNWPLWDELVGIQNRKFGFYMDQDLSFKVSPSVHPITQDIQDFDMVDESYTMNDASSEDSTILLTVDHPKSMKTIAWTRQYQKSRVFCYESGHDNSAYSNPNFSTILSQGIKWTANCL